MLKTKNSSPSASRTNAAASALSWLSTRYVVYGFTIFFIAFAIVELGLRFPGYYAFQPNGYALLSVIEVLVNCALLGALYVRKGSFHSRVWFAISVEGFILLGLGEMFERLSVTASQAIFWSHLGIFGAALIPVGFYMFAYFFASQNTRNQDALLPALLLGPAGVFITFSMGGNSLELVSNSYGVWGYGQPLSTSFLLFTLWLGAVVVLGIGRFLSLYRASDIVDQKKQALVIIVTSSLALAAMLFGDVVPRYLGMNILPLGILFQSILPLGVIYAIYRYDTFAIDFSSIAGDIFDTVVEAIIITDTEFKVQIANHYTFELSGRTRQSLYGQPIKQLFEPEVYATILSELKKQLANAKVATISDVTVMSQTTSRRAVNVSVTLLDGPTPSYIFALVDISQLKKYYGLGQERNNELEALNENYRDQQQAMINLLEDSRDLSNQLQLEKAGVEQKVTERTAEVRAEHARLEASINSLDVGFIIVDKQKNVLTANAAFRTIINYKSAGKNLEMKSLSLLLKDSFDLFAEIDVCLQTGENATKDNLQIGEKVIRVFVAPIVEDTVDRSPLGAVVLVEDITEAKAVERSRDEFFSIASHELRTPLTAIRGNTSMMMDFYKEELSDPTLKEMVDDIHDSSIRLITIVNDFLDTSRLEQGKISFKLSDFNAAKLVEEVIQEFKVGQVNPDLYVKFKPSKAALPFVHADRDRLKQTIINLVGNACKFTEKGGVTVNLRAQDKRMYIEVTDTGKGIPVESRNLLFRKFQQASNNILTRDSTRSTGLGLYISKLIIEGMDGKIYMSASEVGKGSTFVIEIPIAAE